jgi:hypothetical protein
MFDIGKQIAYWRDGAAEDWRVAQDLIKRRQVRHGLFFAHLALEKLLKALSGDSSRDDGLQLADMIAGAARHHAMGIESRHYRTFMSKIVDWWEILAREQ